MDMNKRILIGPSTFAAENSAPLDKLIGHYFKVVKNPFGRKLAPEELRDLLQGVEGIIAGLETLNREVLERSELKVISRCGAGLSNIDLRAAKKLGIKVFYTPDAPTNAVAELCVGAMISLIRHIPQMSNELHSLRWSKQVGAQLEGRVVTIVGFGRIGSRVAELLAPFKVKIICVDPKYKGSSKAIRKLTLDKALPKSDIVTIHASGEKAILGTKELQILKPGAYLLNCARGGIIEEQALISALNKGIVAGAWIDCFQEEPYHGPLSKYPQVILTPHIGSYTSECRSRMEMECVDNLIKGFKKSKG